MCTSLLPRLVVLGLVAIILPGCGSSSKPAARIEPPPDDGPVVPGISKPGPAQGEQAPNTPPIVPRGAAEAGTGKETDVARYLDLPPTPPPLSNQEKYDAALIDALRLMVDQNYASALTALEAARAIQDTEQVRAEIDKVKKLLDQQAAAERTRQDIETVLSEGRAEEAARLAGEALLQYGGTESAASLTKLKRQADALAAAQLNDNLARRDRFRQEAETALRDSNLRAAAVSLEQALQYGDDAGLRTRLDEVRTSLARYDDNRQRALELRRDPARLEEALAALQEAARGWETLQVRREIDECTLALQKRRDRIAVADFEVRGDIGIPLAGRAIADELLPAFKTRFDLVERAQVNKVLEELRLEPGELGLNQEGRQEFGRLAGARYVVVGSVTPLAGLTVHARLIDVRTGLIVQTAKLVCAGPEDLMRRLPQLAVILQMTDEQKMAYEQELAARAAAEVRPVELVDLPPPPPIVIVTPPPPIIVYTPRPAPLGGLVLGDFRRLPPERPGFSFELFLTKESPVKRRLLQISIELGDNLYRRGRYREAYQHFELAFSLSNRHHDVAVRLERCRTVLPPPPPPPPVVVVAPLRPRIAIFNFLIDAPPGLVPVGVDNWAADHLAACLAPTHEVIDRGEVCWWMGRLGLTMREVLREPQARIALAQALNARFFIFGGLRHTASFDVTTHMIDAQSGAPAGSGSIHVQDQAELKLRMQELVRQTTGAKEQTQLVQESRETERALSQARLLLRGGNYTQAAEAARAGLQRSPNSVALQTVLAQAEQQAEKARLEEARRRDAERAAALAEAARKRQEELARQAEAARRRAEQEAKARDEAARRAQELKKQQAAEALVRQAQAAFKQGNYPQAVSLYESAVALKPSDAIFRELAQARAKVEETARARAAEEERRRRDAAAKAREAELARVRTKVEEERKRREAEQAERRKAQEAQDAAELARLIGQGKELLAKGQFDTALAAFQAAARLKKTPEVEKLIAQAQEAQGRAEAEKKGQQAKAELERKLAEEKARRDRAEAEAQKKQQAYQAALTRAQKAFAEKRYDDAIAAYQEAGKLFRTDAVLAGLKQAEEARGREAERLAAEKRKQIEEQKRLAESARLVKEGQAALAAKQYDRAIASFTEAKRISPTNVDVLAGLSKAEQARDAARRTDEEARQRREEEQRAEKVRQLLATGRTALAGGQLDAASRAFTEASRLAPRDPTVLRALQELEQARSTAATEAERKKKQAEYQQAMKAGRDAVAAKRYDEAIKAFTEAGRLLPGDRDAALLLQQSAWARDEAKAAMDAEARKKQEEEKRRAEFNRLMADGRAALAAKRYDDAVKAFGEALKLQPGDRTANALLQQAARAREDAKAAMDAEARKKQDEEKRRAEFNRLMASGRQALAARRYEEAVKAFGDALKLQPGDPTATRSLREAQQALDASRPPPKPSKPSKPPQPPAPPAEYTRQMNTAQGLERQQKYAEAVRAYREALRLVPGDAQASKGGEFAQRMADGQKALAARRFADAVRAFEAALKLVPNHPDATSYLKRAREGKP